MSPPRNRDSEDNSESLEIFTNLDGTPDVADREDSELSLDDTLLGEARRRKGRGGIADEELEVVGDDEDGDEDADDEAGAEDEDAEIPGDEAEEVVAGASDFDPKDVQILVKDAEILDTKVANFTQLKERADADMKTAVARLKTAKEAGDTDGDIQATQDYAAAMNASQTAQNALDALGRDKMSLKARADDLFARAPKDAAGKPDLTGRAKATPAAPAAPKPSKLIGKFKAANPWFGNSKYAAQQERLKQLDRGLAAEGILNKDTPEYFVELGKRFNREHPGLYKTTEGKLIATGARRRGNGGRTGIVPNGGGSGGGGGPKVPANKIGLTKDDLDQMRRFKMDPENMEHRRQWLSTKRELARTGG